MIESIGNGSPPDSPIVPTSTPTSTSKTQSSSIAVPNLKKMPTVPNLQISIPQDPKGRVRSYSTTTPRKQIPSPRDPTYSPRLKKRTLESFKMTPIGEDLTGKKKVEIELLPNTSEICDAVIPKPCKPYNFVLAPTKETEEDDLVEVDLEEDFDSAPEVPPIEQGPPPKGNIFGHAINFLFKCIPLARLKKRFNKERNCEKNWEELNKELQSFSYNDKVRYDARQNFISYQIRMLHLKIEAKKEMQEELTKEEFDEINFIAGKATSWIIQTFVNNPEELHYYIEKIAQIYDNDMIKNFYPERKEAFEALAKKLRKQHIINSHDTSDTKTNLISMHPELLEETLEE